MAQPIHIHIHFGGAKPPQAEDPDFGDESDEDKQYRLMRAYTNGGTLTPEDFEFLKRRGCVRY